MESTTSTNQKTLRDIGVTVIEQPRQSQLYIFGEKRFCREYPPVARNYFSTGHFLSEFETREAFIADSAKNLGSCVDILSNTHPNWSGTFRKRKNTFRWDVELLYRPGTTDWDVEVRGGQIYGPPYWISESFDEPRNLKLIPPAIAHHHPPGRYFAFGGKFGKHNNNWYVQPQERDDLEVPPLLSRRAIFTAFDLSTFASFGIIEHEVRQGLKSLVIGVTEYGGNVCLPANFHNNFKT